MDSRLLGCASQALLLSFLAVGCKPLGAAPSAADGRGDRFLALSEGTALICDCGTLLPFAERPGHPRAQPTDGGARCSFHPAGVQAGKVPLVVEVQKSSSRSRFHDVSQAAVSSYPRLAMSERVRLPAGDALVAHAIDALGTDVVGVANVEASDLVVTAEEHLPGGAGLADASVVAYLPALTAAAARACR